MKEQDIKIITACKNGDWSAFQVLVNSGANIKVIDDDGDNLVHSASQGIYLFEH